MTVREFVNNAKAALSAISPADGAALPASGGGGASPSGIPASAGVGASEAASPSGITPSAGRQPLYSKEEAGAIVTRLCEDMLGVKSYQWVIEPGMAVPAVLEGRLNAAMDRLLTGEPLQYVLGHAEFCGFSFNVNPSVLIPRPETEELCRLAVQRITAAFQLPLISNSAGTAREVSVQPGVPVSDGSRSVGAVSDVIKSFAESDVLQQDGLAEKSGKAGQWSGLRILDLCTGSGCIAWSLALLLPGASVIGVDISEEALETARTQPLSGEATRLGALVPLFFRYDILAGPEGFDCANPWHTSCLGSDWDGMFDIIISNPPYVRESERVTMPYNVTAFEPSIAIFVPDEQTLEQYKAISGFFLKRLRAGGFGFLEINEALQGPTEAIFFQAGMSSVETLSDFRAKSRFIFLKK